MGHNFTPRTGLSLLELLVSLALLALIGVGISGAFGLGSQMWSRTEALGMHAQEIALRSQLRRYLSQILPPTRLTPFELPFTSHPNGLSFITLADTPFAPDAAAMRMTLVLEATSLILTTELLNDESTVIETWTDPIVQKVSEFQIDYFVSEGDEGSWQSEWRNDAKLPNLIRIQMAAGSEPSWPEFIVRPILQ